VFTLRSRWLALPGAEPDPSAAGPRGAGRAGRRALLLAALLALAGAVAPAAPAQALEFRTTDTVTVPAGTVINDDLFAAGETITIAGQVNGDVYAFGRSITVTGTIQRDLIAAGQQITVDGVINGDLRGAGQNVVINGRVDGNVTTGAQLVSLGRQGRVEGSVYGAAQDFDVLGPVGRGVAVAAATLLIGGTVGGNVDAHVERLTVDPAARIAGRIDYTSDREAAVPAGIAAGGVQFHQVERQESRRDAERENPFGGLFSFFNLAWLVGSIIAGVLLVHFLPGFAAGAAAQVRDHPLASFGIGILALFVVPIAALLVAFTIIGLPLSFLAGLGYLLGLYLGWLLLGLAVGGLLVGLARRGGAAPRVDPRWLVVLGLVVLYVLTHLPFIGGLATFVAVCLGLGALLRELAAERPGHAVALPPPA
jgi:cytoskeletal protein CcmA (bactofilin family)